MMLLLGWMELDMPTPVSHPPSWGICANSHTVYPTQKMLARVNKLQNLVKSLFMMTKKQTEVEKLAFDNSEFIKHEI